MWEKVVVRIQGLYDPQMGTLCDRKTHPRYEPPIEMKNQALEDCKQVKDQVLEDCKLIQVKDRALEELEGVSTWAHEYAP